MTDVAAPRCHGGAITWVGWATSLSVHVAGILAAVAFLQYLRLPPESERFRWDVAMVAADRPSAQAPSSPVTNSAPASTLTAPRFESPPETTAPGDAPSGVMQKPSATQPTASPPAPEAHTNSHRELAPPEAIAPSAAPIAALPSEAIVPTEARAAHQPDSQESKADPTPVSTAGPPVSSAVSIDHPASHSVSAPAPPQQVSSLPPSGSPALSRQDLGWLTDLLLQRVNEVKRYPSEARLEHVQGKVVVKVVIREDGSVTDVEIAKSSGSQSLDQAALDAMRHAGPLSLPRPLGKPALTIRVPITYSLVPS